MFGREPVAIAAAIRAIILAAVTFGLKWTPEQITATMLAVEAVLALITRSQVTPVTTLKDNNIDPKKFVAIALVAAGLLVPACASRNANAPIDVRIAHHGGDLMDLVVDAKKIIIAARAQGAPTSVTDPVYAGLIKATDLADRGAVALEAYHTATSTDLKERFKTDAEEALRDIESLVTQALNIQYPPGLTAEAAKLVRTAQELYAKIRGELGSSQTRLVTPQEVYA